MMGFPRGYHITTLPLLAFACIANSFLRWLIVAPPADSESFSSSEIPSSGFGGIMRERLPVLSFRNFAERNCEVEEDVVCAVCLSSFEEEDEIRELRNCCHVFHKDCLDKWVDHCHSTCPMCRSPLLGQQGSEAGINGGEWGAYLFVED